MTKQNLDMKLITFLSKGREKLSKTLDKTSSLSHENELSQLVNCKCLKTPFMHAINSTVLGKLTSSRLQEFTARSWEHGTLGIEIGTQIKSQYEGR